MSMSLVTNSDCNPGGVFSISGSPLVTANLGYPGMVLIVEFKPNRLRSCGYVFAHIMSDLLVFISYAPRYQCCFISLPNRSQCLFTNYNDLMFLRLSVNLAQLMAVLNRHHHKWWNFGLPMMFKRK